MKAAFVFALLTLATCHGTPPDTPVDPNAVQRFTLPARAHDYDVFCVVLELGPTTNGPDAGRYCTRVADVRAWLSGQRRAH